MLKNTKHSYGSVSKCFHWLIFFLVACIMIPLGYIMEAVSDKLIRGQLTNIHKLTGLFILVLIFLRLIWVAINTKPLLPFGTPAWQRFADYFVQYLLYAALIIMPISGWVGSVAGGKPPHLANLNFLLPLAPDKSLSHFAFNEIHVPLAIILIILISIHMLAALYHHFVKKDNILRRMFPG